MASKSVWVEETILLNLFFHKKCRISVDLYHISKEGVAQYRGNPNRRLRLSRNVKPSLREVGNVPRYAQGSILQVHQFLTTPDQGIRVKVFQRPLTVEGILCSGLAQDKTLLPDV